MVVIDLPYFLLLRFIEIGDFELAPKLINSAKKPFQMMTKAVHHS